MGEDVCKFDLLSFLSSINSFKSSINYVIKATPSEYGEKNKTWLKGIVTKQIKNLFNEKKWMINTSTNPDSSMISIVKKKLLCVCVFDYSFIVCLFIDFYHIIEIEVICIVSVCCHGACVIIKFSSFSKLINL
eukprot:147518_1